MALEDVALEAVELLVGYRLIKPPNCWLSLEAIRLSQVLLAGRADPLLHPLAQGTSRHRR